MTTQTVTIRIVAAGAGRTRNQILGVSSASRAASRSVFGLRTALAGLVGLSVGRELQRVGDTAIRINNRLNLLTGSQEATNIRFRELRDLARETRSPLESTVDLFSRLQRSTSELGLSQQELLGLTRGVNQAFRIYGNTAAEAEAATIQFAQGLAAGALRGDELRSVLEQAPRLSLAIADGLTEIEALGPGVRVGIGDLRDLGKQGVLTAELVSKAFSTQLGTLQEEFEKTTPTITEGFQEIGNAFQDAVFNRGGVEAAGGFAQGLFDFADTLPGIVEIVQGAFSNLQRIAFDLGRAFDVALGQPLRNVTSALDAIGERFGVTSGTIASEAQRAIVSLFGLIDRTTELTDSTNVVIETIQAERNTLSLLTDQINENRVANAATARQKLNESLARQENLESIRDESRARIEALRIQALEIAQNGQLLAQQNSIALGDTGLALFNPFRRGEIDAEAARAVAAAEAVKTLTAELEQLESVDLASNEQAIQRLQELLASGTLDDGNDTRARETVGLLKEQERASRELERLQQRINEATAEFARDLSRVPIEAGRGAEALADIESLTARLLRLSDDQLVRDKDRIKFTEQLVDLEANARLVAINDIIAAVREERKELSLSNEALEARKLLSDIEGPVSQEQRDQLTEEVRLLNRATELREEELRLQERRAEVISGLAGRGEIVRLAEEASILQEVIANSGGLFDAEQIRAAEIGIENIGARLQEINDQFSEDNFINRLTQDLEEFSLTGQEAFAEFGSILSDVTEQITEGFGGAIADAIVDGEDFGEALKSVAREGLKSIISGLVELGAQFLINQALSQAGIAASTAAGIAQANALAAAYAPAAAAASLATLGGNAAFASAGLASTFALSKTLSAVTGFADGGFVTGPGGPRDDRVPALLSNGEFVVNAAATRENRQLLEAINAGIGGTSAAASGGGVQVNMNINTNDADSFRRSRRQITEEVRRGLNGVG